MIECGSHPHEGNRSLKALESNSIKLISTSINTDTLQNVSAPPLKSVIPPHKFNWDLRNRPQLHIDKQRPEKSSSLNFFNEAGSQAIDMDVTNHVCSPRVKPVEHRQRGRKPHTPFHYLSTKTLKTFKLKRVRERYQHSKSVRYLQLLGEEELSHVPKLQWKIEHWFRDLQSHFIIDGKDPFNETKDKLDQVIHFAEKGLTVGFIGILKTFHAKKEKGLNQKT